MQLHLESSGPVPYLVKCCLSLDAYSSQWPASMCQGPACRWDLHYLVPRSYLFASSFDEILVVFPLEGKNTSWNRQKNAPFYRGIWKIRKKMDPLIKGQTPTTFLPPPYQQVLPLYLWTGMVVSMAQWMGAGLRPRGFLLRPDLSPTLWYWADTWLLPLQVLGLFAQHLARENSILTASHGLSVYASSADMIIQMWWVSAFSAYSCCWTLLTWSLERSGVKLLSDITIAVTIIHSVTNSMTVSHFSLIFLFLLLKHCYNSYYEKNLILNSLLPYVFSVKRPNHPGFIPRLHANTHFLTCCMLIKGSDFCWVKAVPDSHK